MLFENDLELSRFVDRLSKKKEIIDLVKLMQPLDVAKVIAIDLELCPMDAARTTVDLIKYVHKVDFEGMGAGPNIETNKDFPVPAQIRRDNEPKGEEEDPIVQAAKGKDIEESGENYINNMGQMTPTFSQDQFPQPREDEEGWPYGKYTVAIMNPKTKGRKRGLTSSVAKKYVFPEKPAFKQDLRTRQPGGDGAGGKGIYQKNTMANDNPTPSGGSSWDRKGVPGWSSSLDSFDLPDELETNEISKLDIDEDPPIGAPVPKFYGGRYDGAVAGPRCKRGM
jgi:hypothetical protein